jgi:hypothetical protein
MAPFLLSPAAQQDRPREWGWHMNHPGGYRDGWDRGSWLFSYIGARRRDLEASTGRLPANRLASLVSRMDSPSAARR